MRPSIGLILLRPRVAAAAYVCMHALVRVCMYVCTHTYAWHEAMNARVHCRLWHAIVPNLLLPPHALGRRRLRCHRCRRHWPHVPCGQRCGAAGCCGRCVVRVLGPLVPAHPHMRVRVRAYMGTHNRVQIDSTQRQHNAYNAIPHTMHRSIIF